MTEPQQPERLWVGREPDGRQMPPSELGQALPPAARALPPSGWYPNPQGAGHRYWDGTRWTEHFSGATAHRPPAFWVSVASVAAMVIGAFGPWASALGGAITINGTSGGRDGWLLLVAAVIAALFLVGYASSGVASRLTGAAIFGVLGGIICIVDLVDISNRTANLFGEDVQVTHPAWGIYLGLAGAAALAVAAVVLRQVDGR